MMHRLGFQEVASKTVRGYRGAGLEAEVVWRVNRDYDIGVTRTPQGTYDLVADWWGVGFTHPDLDRRIVRDYAVESVLRRAALLGHQLVEKQEQPDGSVRLVVRTQA